MLPSNLTIDLNKQKRKETSNSLIYYLVLIKFTLEFLTHKMKKPKDIMPKYNNTDKSKSFQIKKKLSKKAIPIFSLNINKFGEIRIFEQNRKIYFYLNKNDANIVFKNIHYKNYIHDKLYCFLSYSIH